MNPGEQSFSSYMLETYLTRKRGALSTFYMDELEQQAREKLKNRKGSCSLDLRGLPFDLVWYTPQTHSSMSLVALVTAQQSTGTAAN